MLRVWRLGFCTCRVFSVNFVPAGSMPLGGDPAGYEGAKDLVLSVQIPVNSIDQAALS